MKLATIADDLAIDPSVVGVVSPKGAGRHRRAKDSSAMRLNVAVPRGEAGAAARSSVTLMASAVLNGLLTFAFWTLIARSQGAAAVGAAAAEIATIMFLAGVASLNLINIFARFLPEAGARSQHFVIVSYAATIAAGVAVSCVFFLTPWAADLIPGGTPGRVGFLILVVATSIFMIQDGGLIGFGKSLWVLGENVTVGVLRLITFPIAAALLIGGGGAIWAWGIPMVAAVLVINFFLIFRVTPAQHDRAPSLPPRRQLLAIIGVESVSTAVSSAITAFLPAIVTQVLGPIAGGYFYIPWLIASTVQLLFLGILISMVRALVAAPTSAPDILRGQLRLVALLLPPAVIVCCLFPQLVLTMLGSEFVSGADSLLRWIGLSMPATVIGLLFWAMCLTNKKPWPVFAMNVATSAAMVTGVLMLGEGDVARVGMLYCALQWLIALAVAWPLYRSLSEVLSLGKVSGVHRVARPARVLRHKLGGGATALRAAGPHRMPSEEKPRESGHAVVKEEPAHGDGAHGDDGPSARKEGMLSSMPR